MKQTKKYVDGFVIPVPKSKMAVYKKFAKVCADAWLKHGALEYCESVAEDVSSGEITSFPQAVKLKKTEVVVFSYAVYKSRKHRDQVMEKVMGDPKVTKIWENMPFDGMRMIWGGFESFVSKKAK